MKHTLTIREASEVSGLSEYSIRKGVKEGIFPAFQFNGTGKYHLQADLFLECIKKLCNKNIETDKFLQVHPNPGQCIRNGQHLRLT